MLRALPLILVVATCFACDRDDAVSGDGLPGPSEEAADAWSARADSTRVLENPHKGLYHHFYDDAGTRYGERAPGSLAAVPGLDHLYLRLPWSQLEPAEDVYDWTLIDDVVAEYGPRGLGMAFAFTCKETAVEYATPRWVRDKGADGTEIVGVPWDASQRVWEPDYGDEVFQAELRDFHEAVAARYGGQPWLRYVQIAAYGTWGEGHNWPATDSVYPLAVQTALIDIYTEAYPEEVLLAITDDWYGNVAEEGFRQNIRQYVETRGITYTDHSPLVDFYIEEYPETFSVRSPELFDAVYRETPIPIELEHYGNIESDGNWGGTNGAGGGADLVRGALATTHATWMGYHGYADEWLADNPQLAAELANRVGYWLFVDDARASVDGRTFEVAIDWRNAGYAPVYHDYDAQLRLIGPVSRSMALGSAGLLGIDAEQTRRVRLTRQLPTDIVSGDYEAKLLLIDTHDTGRQVEVALGSQYVDADGFWSVGSVVVP